MKKLASMLALLALGFTLSGCDLRRNDSKEKTPPSQSKSEIEAPLTVALVPFAPGGGKPVTEENSQARQMMNDPDQIAAGKQLFSAMNCVGCHFHGGGGMGPPLMDTTWIYGGSIENIASSIREGRPKGMPSFRGHVPDEQIWQLAAYVKSLSQPDQPTQTGEATH